MKDFDTKTSTKASTCSSHTIKYTHDTSNNIETKVEYNKTDKDRKINHDREEKAHLLNFVLKSSRHDDKFKRLVKNSIPPSKSSNTKQLRYNSIVNKRKSVINTVSKDPKKTIGRELRKWSANEPKEKN